MDEEKDLGLEDDIIYKWLSQVIDALIPLHVSVGEDRREYCYYYRCQTLFQEGFGYY